MIDSCSILSGFEEVDRVEVCEVDASAVGSRAVRAVLLHVHTKEANVSSVYLFKGKQSFRAVREFCCQLTSIHESEVMNTLTCTVSIMNKHKLGRNINQMS